MILILNQKLNNLKNNLKIRKMTIFYQIKFQLNKNRKKRKNDKKQKYPNLMIIYKIFLNYNKKSKWMINNNYNNREYYLKK